IEWLWLKDVVDLSWEILRLRRLKIDLVEIDREDQNAMIEWGREHATPGSPAEIEARKNKPLVDSEADSAELLLSMRLERYERRVLSRRQYAIRAFSVLSQEC